MMNSAERSTQAPNQFSEECAAALPPSLRIAEIASALSNALDRGSGMKPGHSTRSCILGMRIARELGLDARFEEVLYYSLLLQSAGRNFFCSRAGLQGYLISQIGMLAQTLDVWSQAAGRDEAIQLVTKRRCGWFTPGLVKAASALARGARLWIDGGQHELETAALDLDPCSRTVLSGEGLLDQICLAVAAKIDSRSAWADNHSQSVAETALAIAQKMELGVGSAQLVRYAALLHDVGKLAVPRALLRKQGRLSSSEWRVMSEHALHTWNILTNIRGFEQIREIAASHHERLDGSGYFRGLSAQQLSLEARIVMVADVFDALASDRPYRPALSLRQISTVMHKSVPHALDGSCLEALKQCSLAHAPASSWVQEPAFLPDPRYTTRH